MIHPAYETSREPTRRRMESTAIASDEVWLVELISGLINWRRYVVLVRGDKWIVLTSGQAANLHRYGSAKRQTKGLGVRRYKSRGEALDAAEEYLRQADTVRRLTGSLDQR